MSSFILIAFHLERDELASDLPLMADCKLIIEPLKIRINIRMSIRLMNMAYENGKSQGTCNVGGVPVVRRRQGLVEVHELSLVRTDRWKKFRLVVLILPL